MTRLDHAANARDHIAWTQEWQSREGDTPATGLAQALIAQAEATLALVEQQRIANLIALAKFTRDEWGSYAGEAGGMGTILSYPETELGNIRVRDDIAAALGIGGDQ